MPPTATASWYSTATPAATKQFALGVNYWDTPYSGMVDELKIYAEAVTAEDIAVLYQAELLDEAE